MARKKRKPTPARLSRPADKSSALSGESRATPGTWRGSPWRVGVIGGVAVVVLTGIIYWFSLRDISSSQTAALDVARLTSAVQVTVEAATTVEAFGSEGEEEPHALPPTGSLPGNTAPDFSLPNLNFEEVALADFRGQPVFVSFFHTW